jgi:cobalt-zinc-cadmium efflux system membrane fusion protein
MLRIWLLLAGIMLGAITVSLVPGLSEGLRIRLASWSGASWIAPVKTADETGAPSAHGQHPHDHNDEPIVKLSDLQIKAAGIEIAEVREGILTRRLFAPGSIVPSSDRIARVAVKLVGTVAELRKRLGDSVAQNEVVAVIESRDVADAKSEYLAARTIHDLQLVLFARAKMLREGKVSTENDFLRAQAAAEDARIKMEVARQKLSALGLTEEQIAGLPQQPVASMRRHELRAPIAGRIAERRVDLGALVGREGQESELFVIVDLDVVWADLAVPPADLPSIHEGQEITITSGASGERARANIIFISPLLDKDTRTARVVAALENPAHAWRPGSFITAEIPLEQQHADIVIPKSALQTIKGERVVFVRREDGFEARKVTTAREDDRAIEIVSGLAPAERVAVASTFIHKAELGKAEAGHEH